METVLEINGLTKKYGDLTAVNNISFAIEGGEIFGLLGLWTQWCWKDYHCGDDRRT